MMRADLHVHTYCSDGRMSPAEVVEEAKNNGVRLLAVTDHDCMLACAEVKRAGEKAGITTVNGIEVSAYVDDVKIHTLGYNIDSEKPEFKAFLKELYEGSLKRSEDIISKLNKNGIDITMKEVLSSRKVSVSPVHAMHIAFACAEKGYCGGNASAFFFEYLAWGKCAYSNLCRPSPDRTVELISSCGGFSSLAHPGRIDMEKSKLVKLVEKLKACGLGGIEAVYTTHTVTETAYFKEMAKAYSLLVTGGSDTHFKGGRYKIGEPEYYADEAIADKLGI